MSANNWESHLALRNNPVVEGTWGDDTTWRFYEYNQLVPKALPTFTSMCVPVCSLDPRNPQVMLTLNIKRGGYEIPGGHLDPLDDGTLEPPARAAAREVEEETGLHIEPELLIPFGYTEATNSPNSKYPPLNYMQFFGAYAPENPGCITDPEVDGAGIFTIDALRTMVERGAIKATEFSIVSMGIQAVLRHQNIWQTR